MAINKKGFILYADQKELFDQLPNEKAGELIKHIFQYVNDEDPQTDDLFIKLAFTPIKQQLKRDLKKFEEVRAKRSEAGKASAEARKQKATNPTSVESVEQTPTNPTVKENDNVTVTVTVNDKVKDKEIKEKQFEIFWELYQSKIDRKKCLASWLKISNNDIEKIIEVTPKYVKLTPDVKYRKNPLTWLNGENWNDEVLTKSDVNPRGKVKNRFNE